MESTEQVKNPTGKGGFGDHPEHINPGGRPKDSLKSYVARKLAALTDEEKDIWLKEHNITGDLQWRMGEGNPAQDIGNKDGKPFIIQIAKEVVEQNDINSGTSTNSD